MADKKKSGYQPDLAHRSSGGSEKSSGKGGARSTQEGVPADPVGNSRQRGEDPSPDNRGRGETARSDTGRTRT